MDKKPFDSKLLAQFCETRDPAIREEIILRFVPLVHYVLGRLGISQNMGADYEDAASQGLLGLIEAVDRYDAKYGTQFSTYATLRIRGKVIDGLRNSDWLSRGARKRARNVQDGISTLWEKLHRTPTEEELATHLNMTIPEVQKGLQDSNRAIVSLDTLTLTITDGEKSLHEILPDENQVAPDEAVEEAELERILKEMIRTLPEREQIILSLYYYEELTFKEIGAVLDISESRVCQLHSRIITALQAKIRTSYRTPEHQYHTARASEKNLSSSESQVISLGEVPSAAN